MVSALGHTILNFVGLMPGAVGTIADVINGAWYLAEGDMSEAALSFLSATPLVAGTLGKGAKGIFKSAKAGKYIDAGVDFATNGSRLIMSVAGMKQAYDNIKANKGKKGTGFSNALNIGMGVISGVTGLVSLGRTAKAGKSLLKFASEDVGSLAKSDKFQNAIAKAKYNFRYGKSKGCMDLSYFKRRGSTSDVSKTRWGAEHGKGNTKHNNAIETELDKAYSEGATGIGKNRVQRDVNGNRVYTVDGKYTRPDASYILNGKRYNTNYVSNYTLDNVEELNRELESFKRMIEADPEAINRLVFEY